MLWEEGDAAGISGWSHRLWPCTEKEMPGSTAPLVPEQDRSVTGRPPGLCVMASLWEGQCRVGALLPSRPTPNTRGTSSPVHGEQTSRDFCLWRHAVAFVSDPKSTEIQFPLFRRGGA